MQRISQSEFVSARKRFDEAVCRTPDVAPFTSSSTWCLAAREHLLGLGEGEEETEAAPDAGLRLPESAIVGDTAIWRDESAENWLVFGRSPWGYWQPFEAAWMFACPLIGPEPEEALDRLRNLVKDDPDLTPGFAIGGIPLDKALHQALRTAEEDGGFRRYREFPALESLTINLEADWEAWLSRRSRKFRRSLRSAERRCRQAGLNIEVIESGFELDEAVFDRLLAIQPKTEKWASGTDIFQFDRYCRFYRQVFKELRASRQLRLLIATRDGTDLAYIFGAVFGGEYRGLQMSFSSEIASLGAGNWLQLENLRRRAAEGVGVYDLGMDSEYKQRWADDSRSQVVAFVIP
jgi:hypothetical protein